MNSEIIIAEIERRHLGELRFDAPAGEAADTPTEFYAERYLTAYEELKAEVLKLRGCEYNKRVSIDDIVDPATNQFRKLTQEQLNSYYACYVQPVPMRLYGREYPVTTMVEYALHELIDVFNDHAKTHNTTAVDAFIDWCVVNWATIIQKRNL